MVATTGLPIVDISAIYKEGNNNWMEVAKNFGECLHKIGFVYITGHGISEELIAKCFGTAKEVLNLPLEVQRKYIKTDPTNDFTGYLLTGEESLDEKTFELKRSYDIQLTHKKTPKEVPEYEQVSQDMLDACEKLKNDILRMLAMSLGLEDEEFFVKMATYLSTPGVTNKTGLRALLYPAVSEDFEYKEGMVRCAEHVDWGMITMLFQDDVGGLQVKNQDNVWIDVPPLPGAFVLNVGGMLEVLSKGYFPATWHRIPMTKESERLRKDRYSIGFFFFPDDHVMIRPLEEVTQFANTENKDFPCEPLTAKEYVNMRIVRGRFA